MKTYRALLVLAALAAGAVVLSLGASAATVTVDINGKETAYSGKVIVRQGGGNRVPITIVARDNRLFQFYRSENRVVRIKADEGQANLVLDDTAIHESPDEASTSPARFMKGLEVELLGDPQDGWVQVKALKDVQGWIKAELLGNEVSFAKPTEEPATPAE